MVWGDDPLTLENICKGYACVVFVMSIIALVVYRKDKRRAKRQQWRIPESSLILLAAFGGGIGAFLGMLLFHHKTRKWKFRLLVPLFMILQLALLIFFCYTADYYHADPQAAEALESDDAVTVTAQGDYWYFDGPSEENAYIFYPGGKVEAAAYAPLMHRLAAAGVDSYLVKMPFNIGFFGIGRAERIMKDAAYDHWYIGGHSLGGVAAASFAEGHADSLSGIILLAAYPTGKIDESLQGLMIHGSEDQVLNMEAVSASWELWNSAEYVIDGGNHAQFGDYGQQKGDGKALISAAEQQELTVSEILEFISAWQ